MVCIPRFIHAFDRVRGGPFGQAGREDAIQESLMRVWRDLAKFNGLSKLETWMHRYCSFIFQEMLRRRHSLGAVRLDPGGSDPDSLAPDGPDVPEQIAETQRRRQLWQIVDGLAPAEREVVTFKHLDGLTFAQMAALTEVSINTLKARYYRACRAMGAALGSESSGPSQPPSETPSPRPPAPR